MERYLLFMFHQYYPEGGFHDFRGSFETPEEALDAWDDSNHDYGQIVDLETGDIENLYR